MTTKPDRIILTGYPDIAIPPGEFLQEESEFRGISAEQLAARCGQSVEYIQRVFTGRQEITPDLAASLERALPGTQAYFWLKKEQFYQETLAHNNLTRPT